MLNGDVHLVHIPIFKRLASTLCAGQTVLITIIYLPPVPGVDNSNCQNPMINCVYDTVASNPQSAKTLMAA